MGVDQILRPLGDGSSVLFTFFFLKLVYFSSVVLGEPSALSDVLKYRGSVIFLKTTF